MTIFQTLHPRQLQIALPVTDTTIVTGATKRLMQAHHQHRRSAVGKRVIVGDAHFQPADTTGAAMAFSMAASSGSDTFSPAYWSRILHQSRQARG